MLVADAVAVAGQAQGGHAVHEAGGQPPEAAIAECGVRFDLEHVVRIDPERFERPRGFRREPHIVERIAQKAADQELKAQVINPLAVGLVHIAGAGDPAIDDPVADRQGCCKKPIVARGIGEVLADAVDQLVDYRLLQAVRARVSRPQHGPPTPTTVSATGRSDRPNDEAGS